MFKKPFSFNGRIGRLEYFLSGFLFYVFGMISLFLLFALGVKERNLGGVLFTIAIPFCWFAFAQGTKRCHDMGYSGWFQLIPFFAFVMLFKVGKPFENRFGVSE